MFSPSRSWTGRRFELIQVLGRSGRRHRALAGIALLVGTAVALFALGFDGHFALQFLREHHGWLLGFVAGAPVLASVLFVLVYALAVAISVPGVGLLTVIGGYLFGWLQGGVYVLVAATLGASVVFLLARSTLGAGLRASAGPALQRFAEGFRRHALSYAVALNLVPIFPYAVVIAVPAACGIRLPVFAAGVFFGVAPATFLFARLGSGMGEVLGRNLPLRLSSFMTPEIVLSLTGLAALALLPVAYRALRAQRKAPPVG